MSEKLKYKNGKFRVMLVGDPHERYDTVLKADNNKLKDYLALQYAAIKSQKPDLVILMGDNASANTEKELYATLLRMTKPYAENNIPFSFVLGNHDLECKVSNMDAQYNIYRKLPGCILPDNNELSFRGDYVISVYSEKDDTPALNIWHFYSGNKALPEYHSNYDFVNKKQIDWYTNKANLIKQQYNKIIPAIAIQHIPVIEEKNLLKKSNLLETLLFGVYGQNEQKGHAYVLNKKIGTKGYLGEGPCFSAYNSGEFDAWKKTGDIFAAFFGHDHMNDFVGMTDGIILGQCKTASFRAYGDGLMQGVRILDFCENSPRLLDTKMVRYRDLIGNECSSISGKEKNLRDAVSVRLEIATKTLAAAGIAVLPFVTAKIYKKIKNK